jgi:FecR protein
MKLIYALCGLLLANVAWAVPDVAVEAIRMPAWLERGAQRQPLAVGMELRSGDMLLTGSGSRVLLRTAGGSYMQLGENAQLDLSGVGRKHEDHPIFSAELVLVKGAFRFTTRRGGKLHDREVTLHVAGAAVGTQGADLWCQSTGDGNGMVLLAAGAASVSQGNAALFEMDQPLSSFVMTKGSKEPMPLAGMKPERFAKLARETAIAAGTGAVRSGGRWKVSLMERKGEAGTLAAYDSLRSAGYDARIQPLPGGRYRLRIIQLPSRAEAEVLAQSLTGEMGISRPRVGR